MLCCLYVFLLWLSQQLTAFLFDSIHSHHITNDACHHPALHPPPTIAQSVPTKPRTTRHRIFNSPYNVSLSRFFGSIILKTRLFSTD